MKAPLCQILIPAPWQKDLKDSSEWERDKHTTEELSIEELTALVWSTEESRTPLSEISEELAAEISAEIQDTRLPMPKWEEE